LLFYAMKIGLKRGPLVQIDGRGHKYSHCSNPVLSHRSEPRVDLPTLLLDSRELPVALQFLTNDRW
jgi:hypothetical protein